MSTRAGREPRRLLEMGPTNVFPATPESAKRAVMAPATHTRSSWPSSSSTYGCEA